MNDATLIKTGAVGAVVAAICCATPVLVIALGAIGLSALTVYLDYVLFPALAMCLGMIGYGLYRRRQDAAACCEPDAAGKTATRT
ncbi:MAG: mercury resistance system transport protein MerF [Hyphomicrobiaceae bacterium]